MGAQIAGMLAALRSLRREGWTPDMIHAHVFSAGLPALALGRATGAPVVISEHYTGFQRGLITGYDRFTAQVAFRGADLVAPVSADLARHVLKVQPRARVKVVPNVVDTDAFHPLGDRSPSAGVAARPADGGHPAEDTTRLLTVATLTEKKGHADLFAALVQLGPGFRLDLVGDGELRGELQRLVRSLGLGGAVRFHGARPKEEVAELMREADLFVLPSHFENLPCVLIEAMASGLPSVATAVGGVPGLLDGTGSVLCPPRDPAALARAIRAALVGRPEIDPMAIAASARARFGYETIARTWTKIYEDLRSPSRAGATS
jgi:glycosyltransferase involved in cell wall biosynthesis